MISKDVENRIVKYLSQSADIQDLNFLNEWLKKKENQSIFKEYVKTQFAINLTMNDPGLDKIKDELLREIRKDKKPVIKMRVVWVLKYAAIAILFMGLGFIISKNKYDKDKLIKPREDAITLQLENGEIEVITEKGNHQLIDDNGEVIGNQKGKELVYEVNEYDSELKYNTLTIPKGKRFGVVLSDGTKVQLNAGSSITYPISFNPNGPRKVVLSGEAYFEVSHDQKRQFIVNTQELDVKVYGTRFNITNYPEDENTEVVLIEGSVALSQQGETLKKEKEVFLKPGHMGAYNKRDKNIVDQKVNTSLYTSWMAGNLVFRNETFENITRKLERHYNVVIINNNKDLADETFNATIELNHETIEQVFNYFNKIYRIEYQIVENKIIIN
ncbi:FecR family protein [Maribacter polysaccharolyticus]|uniref:FecR family protein n=1 Tax=Maribacter polysaccharolyticus TaxID=3020831 RepID=UPI00237F5775|nr:FecR family protein [Maribacter polysaccharolyticus]MDE3743469.1 FecR domain-containing protein [Maribacter polysaccharolyticus]